MSTTEAILDKLLEELTPVEEGIGIFVKALKNRKVYTCKCPNCGTLHGGFKTFEEAQSNLKCRRCARNEIEKKKKDIQKVDEPKKQKDIFQHPLNKPAMAEAMEEDDLPIERRAVNLSDDIYSDEKLLGRAFSWMARIKAAPKFGSRPIGWYQQEMFEKIDRIRMACKIHDVPPNWLRYSKGIVFGYQPQTNRWVAVYNVQSGALKPLAEAEDDFDLDIKELQDEPDNIAYTVYDGREFYPVTRNGLIGRQGSTVQQMSGKWRVLGMSFHHMRNSYVPWSAIKQKVHQEGKLSGYLWDLDHGSTRRWGRKVSLTANSANSRYESLEPEEDFKDILDVPYGTVTKDVCLNAHHGQMFWEKATGRAVRVNGKCKTWKTRPDEYSLPVKFGLFQALSITERNAEQFTTARPEDR